MSLKRTSDINNSVEFNTEPKKRKSDCVVVVDLVDFSLNNHLRQVFANVQRSKLLWLHNLTALLGKFYLPIEFRNEKSFILPLFESCGFMGLEFAGIFRLLSKEMKNDKQVVLQAMEKDPDLLGSASDELKNNREFLSEVVQSCGTHWLKYASSEMKNDLEFMDRQYRNEFTSSRRVDFTIPPVFEFMNDKERILEILHQCKKNNGLAANVIQSINKKLLKNTEFMQKVIEIYGFALKYASNEIRSDRELLRKMFLLSDSVSLEFVSDEVKNDKEFIMYILKESKNNLIFSHIPIELRNDREIVLEGARKQFFVFDFIPEIYRNDKQIVMQCLNNPNGGFSLDHTSEELKKDREVILAAVKYRGYNLQYVPQQYLSDREIVLEAVRKDENAIEMASPELFNDSEIFLEILRCHAFLTDEGTHDEDMATVRRKVRPWWMCLGDLLGTNSEFILKALEYCDVLDLLPTSHLNNDREFILKVIRTKVGAIGIRFASRDLLEDRSFLLTAIKENGLILKWLPDHLRTDPEIEEEAVKQCGIVLNQERIDELYAIRMRTCYPGL